MVNIQNHYFNYVDSFILLDEIIDPKFKVKKAELFAQYYNLL